MANIFKENLDINNHPNRNNFDLRHQVHGTYKMGKIYPFLCKPVVPGDSFKISTALGFKFMPLAFPMQSRVRVITHYYAVRNKNLWKNWENFIQGLEEHEHPYISTDDPNFWKTGSLADYLDIPTSIVTGDVGHIGFPLGSYRPSSVDTLNESGTANDVMTAAPLYMYYGFDQFNHDAWMWTYNHATPLDPYNVSPNAMDAAHFGSGHAAPFVLSPVPLRTSVTSSTYTDIVAHLRLNAPLYSGVVAEDMKVYLCLLIDKSHESLQSVNGARHSQSLSTYQLQLDGDYSTPVGDNVVNFRWKDQDTADAFVDLIDRETVRADADGRETPLFYVGLAFVLSGNNLSWFDYTNELSEDGKLSVNRFLVDGVITLGTSFADAKDLTDVPTAIPYGDGTHDTIRVNALPFRAIESIYNAFYRNTQNQPFIVDGSPVYNKYVTTDDDGADTTPYHLFERNWEFDAYTSGLPSPQQGNAPLVGMNALGTITIEDDDGITTAQATDLGSGQGVKIVATSPAASVTHQQILLQLASSGMSINDFRQCNALQRFLETSLRKGFKYVDFIQGHFGNEPKYAELDMPEFIGGYSQNVDVNMISNTSAGSAPLGQFAGQANAFGASPHEISHYFDDYGYVVGLVMIVPDPAYSQILPKHFTYNKPFDYYFPEFSEIGMQPVQYSEVCPIQSHMEYVAGDTTKLLTDTFCYQRPNHELIWYPDTVHGQFRLSLKDYLINRLFAERPVLGDDFLRIKPSETNQVFQYLAEDGDVVMGQIVVDIKAKRPVPRVVIPSLGR